MALKGGVMSELNSMNFGLKLLVLTLLDPSLDSSLWAFAIACPEIYLVLELLLTTIYHDMSNEISNWVLIPSKIETHTAHGHNNNYNGNVQGKHLSAPLV